MKLKVIIRRNQGIESLEREVISETTTGYHCNVCDGDRFGLPKSEWFPKHSKFIRVELTGGPRARN